MNNKELYLTLNKIRKTESPQISMFFEEDQYSGGIFLTFRFKDTTKNDIIYTKLKSVIENFQGNVTWYMKDIEGRKNYVIIPKYFYDNNIGKIIIEEEKTDAFRKNVDDSINDLPALIQKIKNEFNIP